MIQKITSALALAAYLSIANHSVADTHCVALYLLDEGTGKVAKDSSGYENHGVITNAEWVDGLAGTALKFNGIDAMVEIADAPQINLEQYTVMAWVKIPERRNWMSIVAKSNPVEPIRNYGLFVNPGVA